MEEQFEELVVKHESLLLRLSSLEDAVLNIMGFYRDDEDGSTQGRIKFGERKTQVDPVTTASSEAEPAAASSQSGGTN